LAIAPRAVRSRIVKTPTATFKSEFEAKLGSSLEARGVAYQYESMRIKYKVDRQYIPDFILPNGIIIEVKGWLSQEDQRKMKLIKAQHPDLDIRFVFMKANGRVHTRKTAKEKLTNAQWAEKHRFPYAEGDIPAKWLKEEPK